MNERRLGYTLNEMMIVLAVLAALSAMAWPSLRKPLARHRLTAAAKQLRAELMRTRLDAIQHGESLQFRYLPGAAEYRVEKSGVAGDSQIPDNVNAAAWAGGFSNAVDDLKIESSSSAASSAVQSNTNDSQLPDEITFAPQDPLMPDKVFGETLAALPTGPTKTDDFALETAGETLAVEWSPPIVFYPNGRTTDAEIALVGDRNYHVRLSLRGVTGTVTVGQVEFPSEDRDGQSDFENPTATIQSRLRQETPSTTRSSSLVKQ